MRSAARTISGEPAAPLTKCRPRPAAHRPVASSASAGRAPPDGDLHATAEAAGGAPSSRCSAGSSASAACIPGVLMYRGAIKTNLAVLPVTDPSSWSPPASRLWHPRPAGGRPPARPELARLRRQPRHRPDGWLGTLLRAPSTSPRRRRGLQAIVWCAYVVCPVPALPPARARVRTGGHSTGAACRRHWTPDLARVIDPLADPTRPATWPPTHTGDLAMLSPGPAPGKPRRGRPPPLSPWARPWLLTGCGAGDSAGAAGTGGAGSTGGPIAVCDRRRVPGHRDQRAGRDHHLQGHQRGQQDQRVLCACRGRPDHGRGRERRPA